MKNPFRLLSLASLSFTVLVVLSCSTSQKTKKTEEISLNSKKVKDIVSFAWPTKKKKVTSYFGWRSRHRMHEGIDLRGGVGTPIYAAEAGKVIQRGWINGFGYTIIIKHNKGWSTLYAHLSRYKVPRASYVKKGQIIGLMGRSGRATASHLHFEIRKGSDPLDPLLFLPPMNIKKTSLPSFYK